MNKIKNLFKNISSPIVIIGTLFFVFGFVTWLSAILVPYLKIACELNNFQSYLVAFSFYIAYFFMSVPSGWFLEYTGYKRGMAAGLVIMAIGSLIFVPAALTRTYGLFLTGLFIQGTGMAVLQTASNPYVTIIGPIKSAAKRISIMGICNGVAGVLAPAILGFITLKGADEIVLKITTMNIDQKNLELDALASRVIVPYILIMISLLLLAVFLYYSNLPDIAITIIDEPIFVKRPNSVIAKGHIDGHINEFANPSNAINITERNPLVIIAIKANINPSKDDIINAFF